MKSGKFILLLIGAFVLVAIGFAIASNRSSLAQEATPEVTPPELTAEPTPEVFTPTLLPTATPVPTETIVSIPTMDPYLLIMTATAQVIQPGGVQLIQTSVPIIAPATSSV